MNRWLLKADAAWRLGLKNVAQVAVYRLQLRLGIHPVQRVRRSITGSHFFRMPDSIDGSLSPVSAWNTQARYFGWFDQPLGDGPPDWHRNPFTGVTMQDAEQPWWKLSDFATGAGDIKAIWEASRFDWVLAMAQRARTGDPAALGRLNAWLTDWTRVNPAYQGPNWKCGQETSIRVLHLALAAQLLEQRECPEPDLMRLVEAHLARIRPTLTYAIAQDNNHGTSEAAALFVGGHWCALHGIEQGQRWAVLGRRWLENRVRRLIAPDGSFSQYSVNYHRMLLDTLSMAELWRRWQALTPFSDVFYQRARAASHWLFDMVNPETGDAPVLGANDGARLLPLTCDYRDYRPSVQLGMALFVGKRAFWTEGPHDIHLRWLDVATPSVAARRAESTWYAGGGYIVLRNNRWWLLLSYPRYRFRPRHSDALHVDLWYGFENCLRDAGSYSYNAADHCREYFLGPQGHNTVQFDGRDPMPNVGRFLKSRWLHARDIHKPERDRGGLMASAGYRDWDGAAHYRELLLKPNSLQITDRISGFREYAVLRWRLLPDDWTITEYGASCARFTLEVTADVPLVRVELVEGWESRYYMKKTAVPVLEVEVDQDGTLTTTLQKK